MLGAIFAALCCAGLPVILSVLTAIGLGWLRRDAILWPLMFISLAIALWGLEAQRRLHHASGPLVLALLGAIALVAGVVFVHGFPARLLIDGGALALIGSTLWNIGGRTGAKRNQRAATTTAR